LTPQAEQDEIIKFRIAHNKKELADIKTEQAELEVKKEAVIRSQKLKMDQQRSRFNNRPVLHDRYLILNILGKGGFSEVMEFIIRTVCITLIAPISVSYLVPPRLLAL
jgi:tousled-like kinase